MTDNVKKNAREVRSLEFFAVGTRVQSTITLSNPGKEMVKLRNIDINWPKRRNVTGQPFKQVSLFARLRPGQVQKCPLEFDLDPTTPPGTYEGEFDCGEIFHQPFILHILERIELTIYPSHIITRGVPGQRLLKEIVISNEGNVPLNLDREMIMMLYEVDELNYAIGSSLREVAKDGFNNVMENLVVKLREAMVRPMSIKVESEDLELRAGEIRKFNLSLRLPTNLKPKRDYRGKLNIYNCQLSVSLHCSKEIGGKAVSDELISLRETK
jgi:hypothetical protein